MTCVPVRHSSSVERKRSMHTAHSGQNLVAEVKIEGVIPTW